MVRRVLPEVGNTFFMSDKNNSRNQQVIKMVRGKAELLQTSKEN
jgi:hypothetical protein